MNIDRYSDLNSPIHKWDPRFKLFSFLILVFVLTFTLNNIFLIIILVFIFLLIFISKLPSGFIIRILKTPVIFSLIMAPALILSSGGEAFYQYGIIKIYCSGFYLTIRILLKAILITSVFLLIFGTTRFHIVMKAFTFFKVPKNLILILQFTFRYIFLYIEDLKKLYTSARLRAGTKRKGFLHIKTTISIFVTLLLRSYEQSERVYGAMKLRGFSGEYQIMHKLNFTISDFIKSLIIIFFSIFFIILELM